MYPTGGFDDHIPGLCTRFGEVVILLLGYNGFCCLASAHLAIEEEIEQFGVDVEVLATDLSLSTDGKHVQYGGRSHIHRNWLPNCD
jgi:hypothetical protein